MYSRASFTSTHLGCQEVETGDSATLVAVQQQFDAMQSKESQTLEFLLAEIHSNTFNYIPVMKRTFSGPFP